MIFMKELLLSKEKAHHENVFSFRPSSPEFCKQVFLRLRRWVWVLSLEFAWRAVPSRGLLTGK